MQIKSSGRKQKGKKAGLRGRFRKWKSTRKGCYDRQNTNSDQPLAKAVPSFVLSSGDRDLLIRVLEEAAIDEERTNPGLASLSRALLVEIQDAISEGANVVIRPKQPETKLGDADDCPFDTPNFTTDATSTRNATAEPCEPSKQRQERKSRLNELKPQVASAVAELPSIRRRCGSVGIEVRTRNHDRNHIHIMFDQGGFRVADYWPSTGAIKVGGVHGRKEYVQDIDGAADLVIARCGIKEPPRS